MARESRVACPVCGAMNDTTATECSECGLVLKSSASGAEIDALLQDFMEAPPAGKPSKPAEEGLDLDKEIVDELLDSLVVEEAPEQFECPICGTGVTVDAKQCPKCGTTFAELPSEHAAAKAKAAPKTAEPVPAVPGAPPQEVTVRVTEAEAGKAARISGRLMDLVVVGTVGALFAVFLMFGMYASSAITAFSLTVFGFITIGGLVAGFVLFQVSTGSVAQGDRLIKQGRYEEAIRLYDRAIRTGSRPGNAWTSKGVALKRLNRFEDAMRCQRTALKLDPKNEIAWCNLGDLHFHMGRLDEAISAYDKAIGARPRYAIAWNNKGAALARAERFQEARVCHDRAVALAPKYRAAWLNRGEVLARLGLADEARSCIERARVLAG